jgi:uncharacterized protein YbaP (TraB family)
MHLLENSFVDTLPHVIESFEKSDVMYGEMIVDSATKDKLQSKLDTSTSLESRFSSEDYAVISNEFKRLVGFPLATFDNYPPVMVYAIMVMISYGKNHPENVRTHVPIDFYFQTRAHSERKLVRGLETVDDQAAALFDSLSDAKQSNYLLEFVQHEKKEMRTLDILVRNYEAGNIDALFNVGWVEKLSSREMEALLYKRNSNWIKELSEVLDTTKAFIAVGAGHLSGPKGLIAGLRNHGFRVEPMPMKWENKKGAEN